MTIYREELFESHGMEIASVVGCGLDRLERTVSHAEIIRAIDYYDKNKAYLDTLAIGDRRQKIADLFP